MCSVEASHIGMHLNKVMLVQQETEEQTSKRRKSDRERVKETKALETEELCPVLILCAEG